MADMQLPPPPAQPKREDYEPNKQDQQAFDASKPHQKLVEAFARSSNAEPDINKQFEGNQQAMRGRNLRAALADELRQRYEMQNPRVSPFGQ